MTADDTEGTVEVVTSHDAVKFRLYYGNYKYWLAQWRRASSDPGQVIDMTDLDDVSHAFRAGEIRAATFRPDGSRA